MKKPLRFSRPKKRVSFLKKRLFWYGTGLLSLFTFLFWVVVFSPWLKIQEVRVEGLQELQEEQVLSLLRESFWQDLAGIPHNSILLFDSGAVQEKLSSSLPVIAQVSLRRSWPQTLVVDITERKQIATWCRDASCFALDSKGVAYKEVENKGEYAVFRSPGNPVLGQELVADSVLSLLFGFKETFERAGETAQFSVAGFDIGQGGEIKAKTKEGWEILLDLEKSMEWQETKLRLVLQEKVPSERRGDLQYIDLRFGDQAYLKYRD